MGDIICHCKSCQLSDYSVNGNILTAFRHSAGPLLPRTRLSLLGFGALPLSMFSKVCSVKVPTTCTYVLGPQRSPVAVDYRKAMFEVQSILPGHTHLEAGVPAVVV